MLNISIDPSRRTMQGTYIREYCIQCAISLCYIGELKKQNTIKACENSSYWHLLLGYLKADCIRGSQPRESLTRKFVEEAERIGIEELLKKQSIIYAKGAEYTPFRYMMR
jgi:hypothetical protein